MASATMPLLSEHLDLDLTTRTCPPNFSKPFGSFSRPVTPHTPLIEFGTPQPSPTVTSSSFITNKRLRRKPSSRELHYQQLQDKTEGLGYAFESPLSASAPSPSLTSTISTLQSSLASTPAPPGSPLGAEWRQTEDLAELVRYKRDFPNITHAKRLPKQRAGGEWCVYAVVAAAASERDKLGAFRKEASTEAAGSQFASTLRVGTRAKAEVIDARPTARSVKLGEAKHQSASTREPTSISGARKTGDSTLRLSQFNFPAPPGRRWEGTFGHLERTKPLESPTTLHYRGASFDLVNPHASLILGSHDFEDPVEIDGLLDDYCGQSDDSIFSVYDDLTYDMSSSKSSPTAGSDSTRKRTLYTTPEDARRNILGIQGARTQPLAANNAFNESPSARYSRPPWASDATAAQEDSILETQPLRADEAEPGQTVSIKRGSSVRPPSVRSNPFDLDVSDIEEVEDYIDRVLSGGHRSQYYHEDAAQRSEQGGFAVIEDRASAEATTVTPGRNTTISNIVDAYDYSSGPNDGDLAAEPTSVEHARGDDALYIIESDAASEDGSLINPFESGLNADRNVGSAHDGPPLMPPPPPPAHVQPSLGGSELPSTDHTYGATSDILQMTPARHGMGSDAYPWSTGGTGLGMYYSEAEGDRGRDEPSDIAFLRSSSHYTYNENDIEEAAWEDVEDQAEIVQRLSEDSVADVSDAASEQAIIRSPQGQPSLRKVTGPGGKERMRYDNKAHDRLLSLPGDRHQDVDTRRLIRMLENRMLEENISGKMVYNGRPIDKAQRKLDFAELERLKRLEPSRFKEAIATATDNFKSRMSAMSLPRRPKLQNSFEDVLNAAKAAADDARSGTSSTRGLLEDSRSPYARNGLDYSPTADTFRTTPDAPPVPAVPSSWWSPLPERPQPVFSPRDRAPPTPTNQRTGGVEEFELLPIRRCGARPSMRGQTGLLPMQLDGSSATSAPVGRPLTDAELMAREPTWTTRPNPATTGRRPRSDPERALLAPDSLRNTEMLREQKALSRTYYARTLWFPPSALLFGLGAFDGVARAKSRHGVTEMCGNHKFWARCVAAPLGLLVYAVVGLVIALLVVLPRQEDD